MTEDSPDLKALRQPVNLKVETGKSFDLGLQEVKINACGLKPDTFCELTK